MELDQLDRNFTIKTTVTESDVIFRDVRDTQAGVFGLHDPQIPGPYRRLPREFALRISPAVDTLSCYTSGGRCRFVTDSAYVAIRVHRPVHREAFGSHMTYLGSSGFDCYIRENGEYLYVDSLKPSMDQKEGYEAIVHFPDRTMRDVPLNFPLFDLVQRLDLGLQQDAACLAPPAYTVEKPVIFYGSSITQGGCASRPGACYAALLSRRLDFDFYNFGFSGNGLGEPEMAAYLARFDASAFVMDYDFNAPNAAHLEKTHWNFYKILRDAKPDTPILILPACRSPIWEFRRQEFRERRDVIRATYDRAIADGDKKVWWLEGRDVFPPYGGVECTVDRVHPTDLGFWAIANAMEPILREMLQNPTAQAASDRKGGTS